jgi:hypothetical protein
MYGIFIGIAIVAAIVGIAARQEDQVEHPEKYKDWDVW